jgi:signal transduction histidine kinase/CheY-like chemotaxis protein
MAEPSVTPTSRAEIAPTAPRPAVSLKLVAILAAAVPLLFLAIVGASSYRATLEAAQSRLDRSARVAEEHAARVIETNAAVTRHIASAIGDDSDAALRVRERSLHELLRGATAALPQVQSAWIWDSQGHPVASSRLHPVPPTLDVSDREYFRYARDRGDGFFVSERLISRITKDPFFDVTHRRERADGSFAGVISVSLSPAYFEAFYAEFAKSEPGVSVALLHRNGAFIARWPPLPGTGLRLAVDTPMYKAMSQGAKFGSGTGVSPVDGTERMTALRRVDGYPLYVVAGLARSTALAPWVRETGTLAAIAVPAALALGWLAVVATRRTQRELLANQRAREAAEQRHVAEQALRHAQKLEALGQLTGGVAHDFNNLLMVINSNVHLLERLHPSLVDSKQVAACRRAVDTGAKLTRQLLAFSRSQALQPQVLRLQDVLPGLEDLVRTTVGGAVVVSIRVDADAAPIRCDPAELELAVLNLAINARHAMPSGGRFAISAGNTAPGDAGAALAVAAVAVRFSDSGQGIAPDVIDRVFEPFFTTKPPGQGTGLGLSQVYGLCKQSSGEVRIESAVGAGTTVVLHFPAVAAAVLPPAANTAPAHSALPSHVLLVEDNADVAAASKTLVESLGCKVTLAPSADVAWSLLVTRAFEFDLVLSDIVMAGDMNGLDLALRLRDHQLALPVLLVTGYSSEMEKVVTAGFPVLQKPWDVRTLRGALAAAFAARPRVAGERLPNRGA